MTFKEYYNKEWEHSGTSSLCIFCVNERYPAELAYPSDPADLTRCFQVLRLINKTEHVEIWKLSIAQVCHFFPESKQWKAIYDNFEQLYKLYFQEYDSDSMPETYEFMNKIYGQESVTTIKTKKKKEEHCIIDVNRNIMKCQNCGHQTPFPQNELLEYTVGCMQAFQKAHKHCKKR
jgi:hypothetical protein